MSQTLVSIIVPCFNLAKFLPETCRSVLSQTYKKWECIVVDDGSTDDTERVANHFCEADQRFRYLKKENGGLSSARNSGMRASSGDFLLPWDADDLFHPGFLEMAVRILQSNSRIGFVSCYVELFGAERRIVRGQKSGGSENYIFWNNNVACALLRRAVWEDVGGYDEGMKEGFEDWDFWLSATERGWLCHIIEEPLFKYRKRPQSMLSGSEAKQPELVKYLVRKHQDLFCAHVEEAVYRREQLILSLRKSHDYRLGKFLLQPLRLVQRMVGIGRR